jgi:hypothetical protein
MFEFQVIETSLLGSIKLAVYVEFHNCAEYYNRSKGILVWIAMERLRNKLLNNV